MVSIVDLKNIIHQEKQKVISDRVEQKRKRNAEKRKAREDLLSGPTEYIDILRKAKIPINQTDIKQEVNPTPSKILEGLDWQERLTSTHALGHLHGLYLRAVVFGVLFAVYMWL
tara:strand:+ start:81 stop:422 length:342 start_codon:yes stop_codon:yes gene_type:complete